LHKLPDTEAKLTLKEEIMQEIIQSLEQNSGLSSDSTRDAAMPQVDPSKDKLHAVPPGNDPTTQGYTIQEDMKGLTGKLGGLFGM
jgi:hypothetical protein